MLCSSFFISRIYYIPSIKIQKACQKSQRAKIQTDKSTIIFLSVQLFDNGVQ